MTNMTDRIEDAIGDALTRFPSTDTTCEDAIFALFRWARLLADTLPADKREAWACRAYQIADHLAAPEEFWQDGMIRRHILPPKDE